MFPLELESHPAQVFRSAWPVTSKPILPVAARDTQVAVRILIVDDYQVARKTIRSLLNWHSMHVCGEAENGKQAVEKVKELHPDLVLLDINMPVMNGVQAAYEIRQIAPSTKIIFFTIHDSPESVSASRAIGVDAFVPKAAAGTDLIPAVQRLLRSA